MRHDIDLIADRTNGWLDRDVILPAQWRAEVHALADPERRLRLAVLEDAIGYVQRYRDAATDRERALYEDATDWFASPDRSEPFAFESLCDALGLDPEDIRRGLRRSTGGSPRWRPGPGAAAVRVAPRVASRDRSTPGGVTRFRRTAASTM